ncbi:MAG: hypothetical protein MUP16_03245 [Sedimentisphaerales bacterium]|nr:hypothetical protein [Sedimentisphaerales bacterium]
MSKAKKLSKRQMAVIEDLFEGTLDEQAVLDKYNVKRSVFEKWLADEQFIEQFNKRIARSFRQSRLIIARYAPLAAAKLVELTASESQETARKACLDIISIGSQGLTGTSVVPVDDDSSSMVEQPQLSAETASRILSALAEESQKINDE